MLEEDDDVVAFVEVSIGMMVRAQHALGSDASDVHGHSEPLVTPERVCLADALKSGEPIVLGSSLHPEIVTRASAGGSCPGSLCNRPSFAHGSSEYTANCVVDGFAGKMQALRSAGSELPRKPRSP